MFSFRSLSEKPRSLFSPNRTLSPSRRYAARPRCKRCCSSAVAIVDLPEAERPVNQIVKPLWPRSSLRSCRDRDGCHVTFLSNARVSFRGLGWGWSGVLYVAILPDGALGSLGIGSNYSDSACDSEALFVQCAELDQWKIVWYMWVFIHKKLLGFRQKRYRG